jgi:Fic family protein
MTETDERDATYFLIYQLGVIKRSIEELHAYLKKKITEVQSVEEMAGAQDFNHRQLALLSHAVRHDSPRYTMASHAAGHGVTTETARSDLSELARRGLLDRRRIGRRFVFVPVSGLADQLRALPPQN